VSEFDRDHVPTITSLMIVLIDEVRGMRGELREVRGAIERGNAPSALVTQREFASLLAVSPRTFQRMKSAGELPTGVGTAKRPKWKRSDVEAFVAKLRARR
jgi:predicted DNA-binding transcriptional regulator AlpA